MSRPAALRTIDFSPRKYGHELLVDVGWIHDWTTFILTDEPHALGFYEVLLVTRGCGRIWIDVHHAPVAPGVVVFTAPGQVRRWQARQVDGIAAFFTTAFVSEFFRDGLFLQRLHCFRHPGVPPSLSLPPHEARALRNRLSGMRVEARSAARDSQHVLRAMVYELLVRLNRRYAAAHRIEQDLTLEPFVLRFKQLLDRHVTHWHRVADYAARIGVTPGHLNALARRHLGESAGGVIRARLLAEARRRLAYTDESAAAIAQRLGFEDASYFSRFFRREARVAPGTYRAEIRQKHQSIHN
jgi:AraC family transcriptional regulator, transcriptional activator of pobA